jgi:hypothetical protein
MFSLNKFFNKSIKNMIKNMIKLFLSAQIRGMLDVSSYVLLGQFSEHLARFSVRL